MTEVGRECLRAEVGVRKGRWGRKGSYCRVSMWGRRVGDVGRVGKAERAINADRAGEDHRTSGTTCMLISTKITHPPQPCYLVPRYYIAIRNTPRQPTPISMVLL